MKAAIIDSLICIDIKDQKLNLNDILGYFQELSEHYDSEIKLYTSDIKNYIASFNWYGINQWKIDCPIELHKIYRQRYATTEDCILFIKKLYQYGDLDNEENFIDVPIRHFTLDEMIAFKQEDNMMLRGQDPHAETSSTPSKQEIAKKTTAPKKKVASRPLQQIESTLSKEVSSNKVKSIAETMIKKEPKPGGDNSLFSI